MHKKVSAHNYATAWRVPRWLIGRVTSIQFFLRAQKIYAERGEFLVFQQLSRLALEGILKSPIVQIFWGTKSEWLDELRFEISQSSHCMQHLGKNVQRKMTVNNSGITFWRMKMGGEN